jgi:transcriptional regulator with XRE-family HTH domain
MLRADLRRAREAAGITQQEVAERMKWSLSKVTRIESGDVGISADDLRALAGLLGMGGTAIRELVRRNEASRARGWWHDYRTVMSSAFTDLVGMESDADQLREYALSVIPGLLQTPAYAEAVMSGGSVIHSPEDPERFESELRVSLRLRRQASVLDGPDQPELMVVLDESLLYRAVGDIETMAVQVHRLAELARRPQLRIRVLPFERRSHCPHDYVIVDRDLVYVELISSEIWFDDPGRVGLYRTLFDSAWAEALDADRTGQLLQRVANDYASGRQPRPWLWE